MPIQVKECPFEARNIANAMATENLSVEPLDDLDRSLLNIRGDRLLSHDFPPERACEPALVGQHAGQIVLVERSFSTAETLIGMAALVAVKVGGAAPWGADHP